MKTLSLMVLAAAIAPAAERPAYPQTRRIDQVDDHHGVKVPDPYRWLEDANSAETSAWVEAQNALTMPYLTALPGRSAIQKRLTELWNYERFTGVFKEGGRYFWYYNNGLQDRSVLYTSKSLDSAGEVLLDPNRFADKTVALAGVTVSPDGKRMAYRLQKAGSDWMEVAFLDLETRQTLPDRLEWLKFSDVHWSEDSKGVYYSRFDEPTEQSRLQQVVEDQKLMYHRVGTPQADDTRLDPPVSGSRMLYEAFETEDARWLVVSANSLEHRKVNWYVRGLTGGEWIRIAEDLDEDDLMSGSDGDTFFFRTTEGAPKGRLIAVNANDPSPEKWTNIVPESDAMLEKVTWMSGRFIVRYLRDARADVRLFDRTGKGVGQVALPGIGSVVGFDGRHDDTETFFTFTSFTSPQTVYRFDLKTGGATVFRKPSIPSDLTRFETTQVFYRSRDGARIPMFVTHRKGLKLDGSNPVYLYGYGGFNVSLTPTFSASWLVWLEMGGIFAQPALRGGGEYGREWHLAGTKDRKQNVFDDFIGAAEHLIARKYTSPKKIVISGGSNGGLLVAACMLQRPELFGAALPAVGVLDMLRFHKFTIGWAWVADYGSPENPEDFRALYAYSPYHNIRKGVQYPPTLITTADHDDRVVPAHSFKFAAALQAAQEGNAPILIRIQTKAGHGAGKPLSMQIAEGADVLAFAAAHVGLKTE